MMTSSLKHLPRRDLERLSAYLDHELTGAEAAKLEARLATEPRLRSGLEELRETVGAIRLLPQVDPPRNFTLTPAMAGERPAAAGFPWLQFATAFASLAFLIVVGFDAFVSGRGGLVAGSAGERAASMAQQAPSEEQPMMQALPEEAAESGPTTSDELGAANSDSARAGTPTPAASQLAQAAGESAATPPAALQAPPEAAPSSVTPIGPEAEQLKRAVEPAAEPAPAQPALRFTEIVLALAVIGLAAATYLWRPARP